jgi:hypothetical protein
MILNIDGNAYWKAVIRKAERCEDNLKMDLRLLVWELNGTSSGSCLMACFLISGVRASVYY